MKLPRNTGTSSITTFDYLFAVVLLCYPALLFLIQGGMNGSLFLLAVFSLFLLATHRNKAKETLIKSKVMVRYISRSPRVPRAARCIEGCERETLTTNGLNQRFPNYFGREEIIFAIAMSSGLAAIFISQLYHQDMTARYFDSAARFFLAIPILLASGFIKERVLFIVQYAFPLGALAAFVAILLPHPSFKFFTELVTTMMSSDARYSASTSYMNHIHLGDLALMLGCLSLFSVNWIQPDHLGVKLLKITGMIAGLAVSILSGARGGWIAIPIFVAVFVIFRTRGKFFNKIAVAGLLLGTIGLAGYFSVEAIHQGVRSIYSDLTSFSAGNVDTSQGGRLQLWKAALHLIAENPVFGVGAEGFGKAMDGLSATGFITPFAASAGKGEVHNEILANTVRFGIFGLLSILAIYFVPFFLFLRAAKSGTQKQIGAAMMGMCLTLGFFVFGLSVETFNLKMTAAFYSLTVAVLLAATYKTSENNARVPHGNMGMPHTG